jgi:hypothetical protein
MTTILDDEDTVEAQALSTSLDPYGQLLKMLMPRALCISIHDRMGLPIWMSDGCDSNDLVQLVEECVNNARTGSFDAAERDGFARSWNGDTAYVFLLRDGSSLLGAVALSCQDPNSGARPFSLVLGLLRPALQVLNRELVNQYSIGDLQKNLTLRDGDLDLLLDASGGSDASQGDDFHQLLRNCVTHLGCAFGALMIPEKKIALAHSAEQTTRRRRRARARAKALVRVGAGAATYPDDEQAGAREQPVRFAAAQDSRVPDSPVAERRCGHFDAVPYDVRARFRRASSAHCRDDDAAHRLCAAKRVRRDDRFAHAHGVRAARLCGAWCRR